MGYLNIICENQNLPRFVHLRKVIIEMKSTFRQLYLPFVLRKESGNRIENIPGKYFSPEILLQVSLWGQKCLPRALGSPHFKMNFTLDHPSLFS